MTTRTARPLPWDVHGTWIAVIISKVDEHAPVVRLWADSYSHCIKETVARLGSPEWNALQWSEPGGRAPRARQQRQRVAYNGNSTEWLVCIRDVAHLTPEEQMLWLTPAAPPALAPNYGRFGFKRIR